MLLRSFENLLLHNKGEYKTRGHLVSLAILNEFINCVCPNLCCPMSNTIN